MIGQKWKEESLGTQAHCIIGSNQREMSLELHPFFLVLGQSNLDNPSEACPVACPIYDSSSCGVDGTIIESCLH